MAIAGQDFFLTSLRPAVLAVLAIVIVWVGYKVYTFDPTAAEAEKISVEIEQQRKQIEKDNNWSKVHEIELKPHSRYRFEPGYAIKIISVQGGELEYNWDRDKSAKRWLVKPEQFIPASQDTLFLRRISTSSSTVVTFKVRYKKFDTKLNLKGKDF